MNNFWLLPRNEILDTKNDHHLVRIHPVSCVFDNDTIYQQFHPHLMHDQMNTNSFRNRPNLFYKAHKKNIKDDLDPPFLIPITQTTVFSSSPHLQMLGQEKAIVLKKK